MGFHEGTLHVSTVHRLASAGICAFKTLRLASVGQSCVPADITMVEIEKAGLGVTAQGDGG